MKESLDIVLLTTDKETASAVRAAVESLAEKATVKLCKDLTQFRTLLTRSTAEGGAPVAVVDIDQDAKRLLFDLSSAISAIPSVRCVVISREFNEDLVLQAMQAGARHFLRKSSVGSELGAVLVNLAKQEAIDTNRLGRIISVFSCGGGCGATTAAVNLGYELYLSGARSVLLVDLDEHYGSVAQYLGVSGNYGIGHVLGRKGTIDKHLIETSVVQAPSGLDVLLSPATATADASHPLAYENLARVLDACRDSHDFVIVDAPRIPRAALTTLASASWVAVVVFQLMVRDVAFAKTLVDFLTTQEVDREHILPLANRVKRHGPMLRLADSRRAIGSRSLYCVRNQWRKAVKSMNHGQPLGMAARHSGMRRDYRKIAALLKRWTVNGA